MAIAKMKKLTLLAEQANKEILLQSIQKMQSVEIISLSDIFEEELVKQFEFISRDQQMDQLKELLQDVTHSLSYIKQYVPEPGMISRLKTKREVLSLEELNAHVQNIDVNELIVKTQEKELELIQLSERLKELKEEEQFLRKWSNLKFLPEEVENFRIMHVIVGTLDIEQQGDLTVSLNNLKSAYYEVIYQTSDEVSYLIIIPKADKIAFEEMSSRTSFRKLNYTYDELPEDELKKNLDQQKTIETKQQDIKEEMKSWGAIARDLQLAEEYYYNVHERERAKELIMNSDHLFLLSGWIEEEKVEDLIHSVESDLGEKSVAILTDDIKMSEYDQVPIVLKNNKFVEPFEMITEMFSFPKYNEADPTPFFYPFFIIFFGMMSADAGYGLLLFLVTLYALKTFYLENGMKRMIKFLHQLSYSTIAFGLFFGSFFGFELPFLVMSLQEDVIEIMVLSVAIGLVQLIFGLILNGVIKNRQGQRASGYIDGYAWAMILLGIILWVAGELLLNQAIVANSGLGLVLINVAGILIASMVSSENKLLGLGLGLYNLYGVSGYIGDVVSYTRLMALAVASANIAMAFNMILGFMPLILRVTVGAALFIILHAVNIALAFLGGYVHSARLQYVEFFGKFFEGGGRPLSPLKTLEKYIWLEEKNS